MAVAAMVKVEAADVQGQPQTQAAPEASKVELSFKGLISPDEIVALHATYDDVIVCPGLVGSFASPVDPKGRLRIPGALTGAREARRCLKGWHKRAEDSEKVTWWLEQLKERNIEPITVKDVLNGLTVEAWKKYHKVYHGCMHARTQAKWRAKRRQEALERDAQEERELAAAAQAEAASKSLTGRGKRRAATK